MADLLEPFALGRLRLRNRIVSTAHAPNLVEDGHPKDRYRLYHEEKAKGGVGLTMIGGSTNIAPDSPSVFGQIYAGDDSGHIGDGGNPFGLVGVTATFREKPLGGNFSVTANRGRKKWFSMRRYGGYGAFRRAVLQRCKWVGAPMPDDDELRRRYQQWARDNETRLRRHGLEP